MSVPPQPSEGVPQVAPSDAQVAGVQPPQTLGVPPPPHVWGAVQATQAAPPLPQAVVVLPGWQVPLLSQQPFGQLLALHAQEPFAQVWPDAQVTQAAPPVPQCLLVLVRQVPLLSQQPLGQLVAEHTQVPPAHVCPCAQACPHAPQLL